MITPISLESPLPLDHPKSSPEGENRIYYIVQAIFWTLAMLFDPIINFFTQGLADFLALETLRHGTRYENYINIRIHGADPSYGGTELGATFAAKGNCKKCENYFFIAKDSESYLENCGHVIPLLYNQWLSPRMYCVLSATSSVPGKGFFSTLGKVLVGVISFFLVPTIRFRFIPEEVTPDRFENDPDNGNGVITEEWRDYVKVNAERFTQKELDRVEMQLSPEYLAQGVAYQTRKPIGTEHIGFLGLLTQGFKGDLLGRMKAHPFKVALGLLRILNPIGIFLLLCVGIYTLLCSVTQSQAHLDKPLSDV